MLRFYLPQTASILLAAFIKESARSLCHPKLKHTGVRIIEYFPFSSYHIFVISKYSTYSFITVFNF